MYNNWSACIADGSRDATSNMGLAVRDRVVSSPRRIGERGTIKIIPRVHARVTQIESVGPNLEKEVPSIGV